MSVMVMCCANMVNAQESEVKAYVKPIGSYVIIGIENCSSAYLLSLEINVTGENLRIYSDGEEEWVPVTFFQGTKIFESPITPNSKYEFKSDVIKKSMNYTSRLRNVNISVGNPIFEKK